MELFVRCVERLVGCLFLTHLLWGKQVIQAQKRTSRFHCLQIEFNSSFIMYFYRIQETHIEISIIVIECELQGVNRKCFKLFSQN